jgi:hypothetical protein
LPAALAPGLAGNGRLFKPPARQFLPSWIEARPQLNQPDGKLRRHQHFVILRARRQIVNLKRCGVDVQAQ